MAVRKRFQSRKVFVLHGVLLLAVIVVAYFSARAQYDALRDQQLDENRSNQEISVRASAQVVEQTMRLLVASLPTLGDTPGSVDLLPRDFVTAIGLVDRRTGAVESPDEVKQQLSSLLSEHKDLLRITAPTLRISSTPLSVFVLLATPTGDAYKIRVALLTGEQIASLIAATQSRSTGIAAYIGTEDLIIGSVGVSGNVRTFQEIIPSADLSHDLKTAIKAGSIGTRIADLGEPRGMSLVTIQPITPINGTRWFLLSINPRQDQQVDENLSPLLLQLFSGSGLMVTAVAIVFVSTTISLRRGRQRIEQLRTEMLNRDLQKARRIQLSWLPAPVGQTDAVEIAAENQPAAHISGDLYNWIEIPPENQEELKQTVIVIGDVSGHGLPAAFLMSTTQLIVRNLIPNLRDPGICLTELNKQLCPLVSGGQFVTVLLMLINPNNKTIRISSAGQAAPILRTMDSVKELPIDTQLVAGVDPSIDYPVYQFDYSTGDSLLFYTDGAIEAMDEAGHQFGLKDLIEAYRVAPSDPAQSIAKISQAIKTHLEDEDHDDDLTLMALRFK